MTAPRFLAVVVPDGGRLDSAQVRAIERGQGLRSVFSNKRVQVAADPNMPITETGPGQGVVLGTLFERGETPRRALVLPSGEAPLERGWGSYVAFSLGGDETLGVLRDPSGGVDCYWTMKHGAIWLFSDVSLAHTLGLIDGAPDPAGVMQALAHPYPRDPTTALAGVREVLPGTGLSIDRRGQVTSRAGWAPDGFSSRRQAFTQREEAAAALRATAEQVVTTWAHAHRSMVLELSGGLDSSIMAACLRHRRDDLHLVTLMTPDPGADERDYARAVASSLGASLQVLPLDVADSRLEPQRLKTARPRGGLLHRLIDRVLIRHAEAVGADSFFSGGGGDNVFCYLATAAPGTDALLRRGPGPTFFQTVADLASLHGCTVWEAAGLAIRKTWRPPTDRPPQADFLALDALPAPPSPHPWLSAPDLIPGQREHLFSLVAVQRSLFGHDRELVAPIRFPLLSQPLVELCLRIPSWMWIADGRDRAVAREAFADLLPPTVLQRRTKGDFMGLLGSLYTKHRSEMMPLLLEGWLSQNHLLNRAEVEAYLRSAAPVSDFRFFRLLELANTELWVQSWLAGARPSGHGDAGDAGMLASGGRANFHGPP